MAVAKSVRGQAAIESSSSSTAGSLRGQAAMEYLVTYGWAILALFIVVAFLVSSGAFSPTGFAVQECVFQPDLPCQNFILYRNLDYSDSAAGAPQTVLQFSLMNGMGFPMNVTNVSYIATDLGISGRAEQKQAVGKGRLVPSGSQMNFTYAFGGETQPAVKSYRTIQVILKYKNCKDLPCTGEYTTTGRISAIVEDATVK